MNTLEQTLEQAKSVCNNLDGEEGGFILSKNNDFIFIKISNANKAPTNKLTYNVDLTEFGEKIVAKLNEGWNIFASFHTHPGLSVVPSTMDLQLLFTSFPKNYIYSPSSNQLACYDIQNIENVYPSFDVNLKEYSKTHFWLRTL